MAIPKNVISFLEKAKIKYEPIKHRIVYTTYDKARTLKVKPNVIGKTLVLKIDPAGKQASYRAGKDLVFALIPGNKNLDKNKFKKTINEWRKKTGLRTIKQTSRFAPCNCSAIKNIDFISEKVMKNKFKGVKLGAIPPFGPIWKLPTFIDRELLKNPKIIVGAGDYNWSIRITPSNFKKVMPELAVGNFSKKK